MNITFIGAGNVASHLSKALHDTGHNIRQIYSRNPDRIKHIAPELQAQFTTSFAAILPDSDIYIIAVSDDAIGSIAAQLSVKDTAIVAHTAGTVSIKTLHKFVRHGIFYPLQTFSIDNPIHWATLPFIVQGNDNATEQILYQIADNLSDHIYCLDDEQRKIIHIGAVFVNNFTNYLMTIASDILAQHQLPFDILKPLIQQTAQKVQTQTPQSAQTGPAKRKDLKTIEKQIELLKNMPIEVQNLYKEITQLIMDRHKIQS